jgi:hypothetical protein
MENNVKIATTEVVQKGVSILFAVMLAFIAYFLQKIDKNIENIAEKTTKLEQRYAVFEANQQSDKTIIENRFKVLEAQIAKLEENMTGQNRKR